jgi:hypothetical protein
VKRLGWFLALTAIAVAGSLLTLILLLVGLFSDWSGRHELNWPALLGAVACGIATVMTTVRITRRRRRDDSLQRG